jgi:alkyl hydroperoxide reductase subunit AhpC
MVRINEKAPDFTLEGTNGEFKLSNQKGKWTVLFFYPLDFTFVCPTEVTEFSKQIEELKKANADVVGVSIDSIHSHRAWIKSLGGLNYTLLSDIHKKVSNDYDGLIEDKGFSLRGTFIIDPELKIKFIQVNDTTVGRSVSEVLRVLKALQTGELCQVEWKPGTPTLGKS